MTSAWYCSQYVHVNNGHRKVRSSSALRRPLPFGLARSVSEIGPVCVVALLDGDITNCDRVAKSVTADIKRTSLLPIESGGFLCELSGAYNNDFSKELDEYHLQKNRARQNIQRHRANNRRSSSFDLVTPNLSICSKGKPEYTEKKVHPRQRPVRLLPPSDVRLNHILPEDLNSTILTGHQIINPAKDSNGRAFAKESSGALEKNSRTVSLASTSSLEQQYLQHQCQQLHLQQRQQQQQQQSQHHPAADNAEQSGSTGSTKFQMPVLSKKLTTRASMPSMSSSMPSLKVTQKQPVEPHYADVMVNCPLTFHQRIAELILLESDTIRWEKSKKTKKKLRDNS